MAEKGAMTVKEAGLKGGRKTKQTQGPDFKKKIGKMGGEAAKQSQGPGFYEKIGKKGAAARRKLVAAGKRARRARRVSCALSRGTPRGWRRLSSPSRVSGGVPLHCQRPGRAPLCAADTAPGGVQGRAGEADGGDVRTIRRGAPDARRAGPAPRSRSAPRWVTAQRVRLQTPWPLPAPPSTPPARSPARSRRPPLAGSEAARPASVWQESVRTRPPAP